MMFQKLTVSYSRSVSRAENDTDCKPVIDIIKAFGKKWLTLLIQWKDIIIDIKLINGRLLPVIGVAESERYSN
jgi:hypothetical protein